DGWSSMERSDLVAAALLFAFGCVPVVDESGRACPCTAGYVCCPATNTCMAQGSSCATEPADASVHADASHADASADASQPSPDASPDASQAHDAAPVCGNVPAPVLHFPFDDCDERGVYRDRAGGFVGVRQGPGVRCTHGPYGPAIAFDGQTDA